MSQSPNRLLGVFAGTVFVLVGLLGFFVATPYPFATTEGGLLIGLFASNAFLASIHVVIGAIMLLCGLASAPLSKIVNTLIGAGLFLLGVFGIFAEQTSANVFALNSGTTLLHFLAGAVLVIIGFAADRILVKHVAA